MSNASKLLVYGMCATAFCLRLVQFFQRFLATELGVFFPSFVWGGDHAFMVFGGGFSKKSTRQECYQLASVSESCGGVVLQVVVSDRSLGRWGASALGC